MDWCGERNKAGICQAPQYAILIAVQPWDDDEMKGSVQHGILLLGAILFIVSCATQPKPVIHSVCVDIRDLPPHEVEFMLKHTQSYLAEYGMVQSPGDCDVQVKYQPFGKFQAEEIGAIVKAGYWSQEGNVTVSWNGRPVVEDDQINVRGSDSRQDLLDAVAWQVVKPVTKAFKGASPPR
jgi:hypothetical protein